MTRRLLSNQAILAVFVCLVMAATARAQHDVANIGRTEFNELPNRAPPRWNLDNLEYPADAITVENLEPGNQALRIGSRDPVQAGRYTITLRGSSHDWDPCERGVTHSVSVRFAAAYSGAAFLGVSVPGGGALVDIGQGKLTLWQRVAGQDEQRDETQAVRDALGGNWRAEDLHTYTVEWQSTAQPGTLPCKLLVDGRLVREFVGRERPLDVDPTLELSFEYGAGTALVDFVEWRINGGRTKPAPQFAVERGVRQLFLDDLGIESAGGLRRVVNQPQRHAGNPIVQGEHPWEKASASVYGTMLYNEPRKRFRLWYLCTPAPPASGRQWVEVGGYRRVTNCTLLAYAESEDALHWTKPELNQLSFEGSTRNNLIAIGIDNPEGVGVLFDPADPDDSRRFKAFFWDRRVAPPDDPTGVDDNLARIPVDPPGLTEAQRAGGMWVAFSPDGLDWTTHGPVLPAWSDTTHTILYDARSKKYVAYGRMGFGRTVAITESDNALDWSEPRRVLACDAEDGPAGQIYGLPTDLYEGLFVGMFWMYREGTDARIDTQLAVSRDGRRWRRVADRQTFLPNAPEGSCDDGMSRAGRGINVVGDTIYLHYSMVNGPHRSPKFPMPERSYPGAIGLVTLRRDGFVSFDAGESGGVLTTKAFSAPTGSLHLNADAHDGEVRVEMVDSAGRTVASSQPVTGDQCRAAIVFDRDLLPSDAPGIRLRFVLRNARLFSYWFE